MKLNFAKFQVIFLFIFNVFLVDFGPNFHLGPLLTAEEGKFIQSGTQLSCHDFDHNCRWRNSGKSNKAVRFF